MTLNSATLCWLLIYLLGVPALANGNLGDVSVLNGTRVTLSCTLPATGTLVAYNWRRDTTALGYWDISVPDNEPVAEDGYEMTIDPSTGYSEFTLKAVDLDDDGRFFCDSSYVPTPPVGNPVDNMTITVLVELDNIRMMASSKEYTEGESVVVVDGNDIMFTCASQANKPEALFDWTVAGKAPGSAPPTSKTPNADESRLWDSTSDYTYTALWENHDAAITCTAKNEALPSGIGTSIVLDVKVPPKDGTVILSDPAPYNNLPSGAVRQDIEHVFQCNITGTRPESDISWRKGGQAQNGQKRVEHNGLLSNTFGSLNFVPNRNDHQLVLQCEADIEVTSAQTVIKQLTLNVYGPPDDPILTGDTEFIEQIESDLICNAANGFPGGGKINWFKDGTLIQNGGTDIPNSDRFDIRDTYSLTPLRSDNGKLIRCQVQHETLKEPPYPATETTINVKFCSASVSITQCPSVEVGQSATLSCTSSSSNPKTSIEWYEKSDKLQNTGQPTYSPAEYNGFNTTQTQDTRVINRTDYMDVQFKCCGVNSEADCTQLCSDPCVLNVLYSPENVEVSKSSSDPVEEGEIITLTCTADGNPEPGIFTWHHDSSVDIGDGTDTLGLNSIEKEDAGYYMCVAGNGISPDKSSEQSAVIVHYSPIIEEETDSRGVNPGEDVTFDCTAEGLPNPAITWYDHYGNTISNDTERMTIVNRITFQDGVHGTFIVSNLMLEDVLESDYGTYVCEATNSIGQPDSLRVHLNGTTVPEPVKALNITDVTINSITVEWTPAYSGGEKLEQSFVVDFRRYTDNTPGEWSEAIEITNGDTHYQVTGLLEETKYDIRVFSKNDIGRNENGQITTGSTGYNPIAPTSLTITDTTTSTLKVTWVPGEAGVETQWFFVDFREFPNGEFQVEPVMVEEEQTEFMLGKLLSDTNYEVAVYSENKYGRNTDGDRVQGKTSKSVNPNPNDNTALIAGSVSAGVILTIIIIVLVIYLVRGSPPKSRGDGNIPLQRSTNVHRSVDNTNLDSVDETAGGPMYAAVDKTKKSKAKAQDQSAPTYAAVNKKEKNGGTTKTGGAEAADSSYANVNFRTDEDVYDDVANVNPTVNEAKPENDGKTVDADGLIYQEVGHFKSHPKDAPPIQTDAPTEYAALDFNRLKPGQK